MADLLLQGFAEVSLTYAAGTGTDEGSYQGLIFEIISDDPATDGVDEAVRLTLNFDTAQTASDLEGRFGLANNGAALNALFEGGGRPRSAGDNAELSIVGIALLNDFFGDNTISITDSLTADFL